MTAMPQPRRAKRKKPASLSEFLCRESVAGYMFISLFIIGFLVFTIIPMIASLYLSFTNYNILGDAKWIGIANYVKMFTRDSKYLKSLSVTFFYAFVSVPLKLLMALIVAMIMTRQSRVTGLYRSVYYLPSIIGGSVAVAVMWKQLFASDGVINSVLQALSINSTKSWIGSRDSAIWVLILLTVWQFGSSMLIFLAGLKQIPKTYYEAATMDGAGKVRGFFSITLPLLTPTIFFNLVMQTINGFMVFNSGYIITQGKPLNSTLFYALYLYQCVDLYNPKTIRSSMGAMFRLPLMRITDMDAFFAHCKEVSLPTCAAVVDRDADPLGGYDFCRGAVVLIGNEGNGLPKEVSGACDKRLTIPMAPASNSLNAAMAAGLFLWEMAKS